MGELDELYQTLFSEDKKQEKSISMKDIVALLKEYWSFIWKKKWFVVGIGILGGIIGFVYASVRTITYQANYVFTVGGGSTSTGMSSISMLLGMGGGSMDAFSGDNLLELLKSRSLVENTLLSPCVYEGDSITFMEYLLICDSVRAHCSSGEAPEVKDGFVSLCDIEYPIGQDRATFSRAQDSILMGKARGLLKENIAVARRDKKLSYMEYSFSYKDELFAKRFSEAHLNAVKDFYVETKTGMSVKNIEKFQHRADSIKEELGKAIALRAAYLDHNRNASGLGVSSHAHKIEMDIQVLSTTYAEVVKNLEALKLDQVRETPLIQIIDKPYLPLPNDKMRKLKGLIVGGFLAGFFSVLGLILWSYLKKTMEENENHQEIVVADNSSTK